MGNTAPSSQITSQIINKHWQPLTPTLWKNKATCEIIKEKRLVFQSQQQMRYVFGCLVRRINNYHPNVLKVFYLRKHYQKASVCNCGEKHTIQVYLQNVQSTLQKYLISLPKNQQQLKNIYLNPNRKCLCMQIVKAAMYLKERYGPFIVNKTNLWIQQPYIQHQFQEHRISSPSLQIQKLHQHHYAQQKLQFSLSYLKAKLWISAEQQQNYPDNSCQEKEMCKSIVELIRNDLVRNKLCGCYPNLEVLERYLYLNTVKDLQQNMRRQHEAIQKCVLITSNVVQGQQKIPFTRTLRSFSSQDSSCQPQTYFAPNFSQLQNRGVQFIQQPSQRKYSSIQIVRKPIEKQHFSMTIGRNLQIIKNPLQNVQQPMINNDSKINFSLNEKSSKNVKIDSFVHEGLIPSFIPQNIRERPKANTIYEKPKQQHNLMNFQNVRTAQMINSRSQYRHGNHFINRQILNIADMTGNSNLNMIANPVFNTIKTQRQQQLKKVTEYQRQSLKQNNTETFRYRSSSHFQNGTGQVSNIDFSSEVNNIKCISISLDKGTDPTDRTKFDLSLKEDQKKQQQAINTSRKNISIIPVSMQSTSGAGSILKPIIHSHDQFHKVQAQNRDFQQQIIQKNQQSVQQSKQKKQSASSSKSQKNYTSYQVTNSKNFQNQQKRSIVKKRMSDSIMPSKKSSDANISKQNINLKESMKKQKQRSQSTLNRLQDFAQVIGSEEMGRLRKSQYILSQHNSLTQSKEQSIKQSRDIVETLYVEKKNELTSLALMEFKFKTNVSIDNKNENLSNLHLDQKKIEIIVKPQVSIRECTSGELMQYDSKEVYRVQQNTQFQISQRHHEMSSDRLEKLKETPQSSRRQSLKDNVNESQRSSSVQQSLRSIQFQPQTFSKIDSPYRTQPKAKTPQMSQLIKQEIEWPSISLDHLKSQQLCQYQININNQQTYFYQDSLQSLERQKQMSHPVLTQTNMIKKLSLKEEFNQLLNFDDDEYDQSLRAKAQTQNKQKKLKLDQRQGRQTVSIYNQSQYNQSDNVSKRTSQQDFHIKFSNPPLNKKKQTTTVSRYARENKVKKPISKDQLDKQMIKKKMEEIMLNDTEFKQANPKQVLRLTSSGHEDNSIKQKVISKKAQFAQLKNQMNNLLL